jgi:hypothetical protein
MKRIGASSARRRRRLGRGGSGELRGARISGVTASVHIAIASRKQNPPARCGTGRTGQARRATSTFNPGEKLKAM